MILHFPLSPSGLEEGSGPGHKHGQHRFFPNWDSDGERPRRTTLMGQVRTGLQTQQGHGDREGISVPSRTFQGSGGEETRESPR